jgi:hypothetical protein
VPAAGLVAAPIAGDPLSAVRGTGVVAVCPQRDALVDETLSRAGKGRHSAELDRGSHV